MKKTLSYLQGLKSRATPIVCLTAYDAAFSYWAKKADVDVLLVGDSLGMVVQGQANTLAVNLDQMVYHTQMVQRTNDQAWCIADVPFMADATLDGVLHASARLIKEGGADMVKLEGGERVLPMVEALAALGVPVCGHLGLLPQSVLKKGYRVQGREPEQAQALLEQALALESAGVDLLVLECGPASLAKHISRQLQIPVIGIGAGADTDGQVLVVYDILGLTFDKTPKFSHNFLQNAGTIDQAICAYVQAVRQKTFPTVAHEVAP